MLFISVSPYCLLKCNNKLLSVDSSVQKCKNKSRAPGVPQAADGGTDRAREALARASDGTLIRIRMNRSSFFVFLLLFFFCFSFFSREWEDFGRIFVGPGSVTTIADPACEL